ncbi:uncharacterized protein LOC100568610 isoform X2 [Acyrthosiphon pisum]|uniref:Uncharacterized protein n=1 Tax=Acyrthosiphon pisum TaxID=7029 RepID=A0A8R2B2P5_ACYPI|nr:uncharacterized protein LOC100568610 isoform X2 [Acyrthosiphon pisum]|eukprot:XP_008180114.1 PREDICTED: uncharacterized protein LOC100568610 isoform X2 [Acyrthosiphon pisum]
MSVITKSLHENKNTDSYLSFNASEELERISHKWNSSIRKNIALEPNQILQILIIEVKGIKLTGVVYQINTLGVGYKPFHRSLLEIFLQAKFERLYSDYIKPEWNVSEFNVLKMNRISTT